MTIRIINCTCINNGGDGIRIENPNLEVSIEGTITHGNGGQGIRIIDQQNIYENLSNEDIQRIKEAIVTTNKDNMHPHVIDLFNRAEKSNDKHFKATCFIQIAALIPSFIETVIKVIK